MPRRGGYVPYDPPSFLSTMLFALVVWLIVAPIILLASYGLYVLCTGGE